jgi:hypothetical protein
MEHPTTHDSGFTAQSPRHRSSRIKCEQSCPSGDQLLVVMVCSSPSLTGTQREGHDGVCFISRSELRSMRRGGSSNRRLQGWSRECETQLECLKTIINLTIDFLTHNQDVARTIPARMKGRRSSAVGAARTAGTAAAERNRMAVRTGTPSASAAPAGCNGGGRPRTAAAVDIAAGGGGGRPARTRPSGNLQARRQATRNGNHFNAANILQSAKCLRGWQGINQRTQNLKMIRERGCA